MAALNSSGRRLTATPAVRPPAERPHSTVLSGRLYCLCRNSAAAMTSSNVRFFASSLPSWYQ
jgi:hypothetical protein